MSAVLAGGKHRLGRLLLACVSHAPSERDILEGLHGVDGEDLPDLLHVARAHRIGLLVHRRLSTVEHPLAVRLTSELEVDLAVAQARHQLTLRAVRDVASALRSPFLVLKGPALSLGWYDDPTLRIHNDLDLLVRPRDFPASLEALRDHGFDELSQNWRGFLEHRVAEIPLGRGATCVDLHWDLIALGRDRRAVVLDVEELFDRAVPRTMGTVEVRALDATDTLLHLCVNSGLDGARRLSRLVDVDKVARDGAVGWTRFVAAARRGRAHALAHAVLRRAHVLLGTPVPAAVLSRLSPFPGWVALDRPRLRPDSRLHRGVSAGLLPSSGRATIGETAVALGRSVRQAWLEQRGRGAAQPGGVLDWQRRDPAGTSSREDYLAWVTGVSP